IETLCAPTSEGGKNLLHLQDRNNTIELKWIKGLLAPQSCCPTWASFAHTLIAKCAQNSPVVKPEARINTFLQSWSPSTKGLPPLLQRMMKTARKYNIHWETISVNSNVVRQIPAWFHIGATKQLNKLNNCFYAQCLRENHLTITISQIESIAMRQNPSHRKNKNCSCTHCASDRISLGCAKPFKCKELAVEIMKCIQPKWHPQTQQIKFNLDLTEEQ
ncbi:hypothetical protein C8R48DRAFT_565965, partial [Suillus tomentosus]